MKYEWKKQEKELYTNIKNPTLITVPKQKFITITGEGNPNRADFAERVGILMPIAYKIKMSHKSYYNNNKDAKNQFPYGDYSVFPLEGIWTSNGDPLDKENLKYTIMVRQPDFVTTDMFKDAVSIVEKKKPSNFLKEVKFETIEDGLSVQMLHVGSYDNEPVSFRLMEEFMEQNHLIRTDVFHKEIYLKDPRKTKAEKNHTILRYCVKKV